MDNEETIHSLKWNEADLAEVCRQARYYAKLERMERARLLLEHITDRPRVTLGDLVTLPVTCAK